MEVTINIKEQTKFAFLINLLEEFDYVEILDIKDDSEFPAEHKQLLEERLTRIKQGKTTFKSWSEIKKKYEKEVI
jgi:Putative addiction module component